MIKLRSHKVAVSATGGGWWWCMWKARDPFLNNNNNNIISGLCRPLLLLLFLIWQFEYKYIFVQVIRLRVVDPD